LDGIKAVRRKNGYSHQDIICLQMKSFFRLVLLGLVLLVVALVSAVTAMQVAIHGREVNVPNLAGKTPAEARRIVEREGLSADVESQYYSSSVPEGDILSQVPIAGTKVRRGWQVRVAQSLGPQRVQIPDAIGESERAAEINIKRRGLDISSLAKTAMPGYPADRVVAQSPRPNASEISVPQISLLISDSPVPAAFVMPAFTGQTLGGVTSVLRGAGLQVGKAMVVPPNNAALNAAIAPASPSRVASATAASVIVSQDPIPGQKVVEGASVSFTVR
jgi:beta-lactam-binding protein with PASTA domain